MYYCSGPLRFLASASKYTLAVDWITFPAKLKADEYRILQTNGQSALTLPAAYGVNEFWTVWPYRLSITKSEWTIQIPEFMYRQISSSCEPGTRLLKVWNADEVFRKRMISSKSERKYKTEGKNKILIQPKTDPSKLRNCRQRNGQLCFASATARGGRAWATTVCRWNSRSIYQSKNKSKRCPPLQCN